MSVTDVAITPLLSLLLQLCPAAANKEAAPKQKVQGSCSDVCQQRTGGEVMGRVDGWVDLLSCRKGAPPPPPQAGG